MTLRLRLFGPPDITINDISLVEQMSSKAQAILYYLAATGEPQRRTTLASLLWGDVPEAAARANLRRALLDLRASVADYLLIERNSVAFRPGSRYWIGVVEFKARVDQTSAKIDPRQFQAALELYRGDFLAGFYARGAPDFESWAAAERERLRELVIQALYTLADQHTKQGELAQGIAAIRRVLALEPWREEAHRHLMLLLARSGQRSAALAQFETCRQILDEELGVEPGAETVELYERIRAGKISVGAAAQTSRREAHWPPTPTPPSNLPPQPTPLIVAEKKSWPKSMNS